MQIADEDGLSAVTMSAVAARIGLTTMALYRYFPNKEALLDAIVDAGLGSPPNRWRSRLSRTTGVTRAKLPVRHHPLGLNGSKIAPPPFAPPLLEIGEPAAHGVERNDHEQPHDVEASDGQAIAGRFAQRGTTKQPDAVAHG